MKNCHLCGNQFNNINNPKTFGTNYLCFTCRKLARWIDKFPKHLKTFEGKARWLSPSQMIVLMCQALLVPHVEVVMRSFGGVRKDRCIGCAATNLVCEISGKDFQTRDEIDTQADRARFVKCNLQFFDKFEDCIDDLRSRYINDYTRKGRAIGLQPFDIDLIFEKNKELAGLFYKLNVMQDDTYLEEIPKYLAFARAYEEATNKKA